MDETELQARVYSYGIYAAAIVVMLLCIATLNPFLISICAALLACSVVYLRAGHILNGLLIKRSMVIEMCNGARLEPNLVSVTRRVGDCYSSISVARLLYEGHVQPDQQALKSLIESMREPFAFTVEMSHVDKRHMLEGLATRRGMKEIQLARVAQGRHDRASSIRRELELIDSDMAAIAAGGNAFQATVYVQARASAQTSGEASRASARSIERICDAFSTTAKLKYEILRGEELVAFMGAHR